MFFRNLSYAEAFIVECFATFHVLHYVFRDGKTSTKFRFLFLDCLADFNIFNQFQPCIFGQVLHADCNFVVSFIQLDNFGFDLFSNRQNLRWVADF